MGKWLRNAVSRLHWAPLTERDFGYANAPTPILASGIDTYRVADRRVGSQRDLLR